MGYGRGSHEDDFAVFELEHGSDTLDVVLDSHLHDFDKKLPGKKILSLEGDFDKKFTVFIPENYQIEALEILTPDVMEMLESIYQKYSIEFNGSKLFIFSRILITKKIDLDDN